jgi:hypothetical protein
MDNLLSIILFAIQCGCGEITELESLKIYTLMTLVFIVMLVNSTVKLLFLTQKETKLDHAADD